MKKHLAVRLFAVTAAVALAAVAWTLVRLVSDAEWPPVAAQWPPENLTLPAIRSVPPPPPPLPCECFGYFDEDPQEEDLGDSSEAPPVVRLADAGGQAPVPTKPVAPARVSRLSDSEASRLLASLPPMPRDEVAPIAGPAGNPSMQAPLAGAERAAPLTAQREGPSAATPAAAQLLVLRTSPRGNVTVAPQLAALFSEPMTPIGWARTQCSDGPAKATQNSPFPPATPRLSCVFPVSGA